MTSFLVDPKYNPTGRVITPETRLGPGITMATFLGSYGNRGSINVFPDATAAQLAARHLYLHAELLRSFKVLPGFRDGRLEVVESVGPGVPAPGSNTEKKQQGRLVIYELINNTGKPDGPKTFDLALFLKDHMVFDQICLSYDRFCPDGSLRPQLAITVPEVSETYSYGTPAYGLCTYYNGKISSAKELVEIL